jgi:hypothetical protein
VMLSSLARSLGIRLATQLPPRKPKPPKPAPLPLRVLDRPAEKPAEPEDLAGLAGSRPRVVQLADPRPAAPPDYVPGHADGRVVRARHSVGPARRVRRRPPGYGR